MYVLVYLRVIPSLTCSIYFLSISPSWAKQECERGDVSEQGNKVTEGDFGMLLLFIVAKRRLAPRQPHSRSCRRHSHVKTLCSDLPAGYFSYCVDGQKRLIGFYRAGFIKHLTIFMPEIIGTFFNCSPLNKGQSAVLIQMQIQIKSFR